MRRYLQEPYLQVSLQRDLLSVLQPQKENTQGILPVLTPS